MTNYSQRDRDVGAFFTANADRLYRSVARRLVMSREGIDDACATAWTILLGRPDVTLDARGFSWLVVVACNEARRLIRKNRREYPAGSFRSGASGDCPGDEFAEPPADTLDVPAAALARLERDDRMATLRALKPREREALFLRGLGYSYREIMEITDSTYTAVNRRITEGRAALRATR